MCILEMRARWSSEVALWLGGGDGKRPLVQLHREGGSAQGSKGAGDRGPFGVRLKVGLMEPCGSDRVKGKYDFASCTWKEGGGPCGEWVGGEPGPCLGQPK